MNPFIPTLEPYFDWLTGLFGHLADEAIKNSIGPGEVASDYLSNSTRREHFDEHLPTFFTAIKMFWGKNGKKVNYQIQTLPGLKARFGGDIGPNAIHNIFQRAGLYYETIIVPDPLLRIALMPDDVSKKIDFYFLKYSINQILLKKIFLADVYPPIGVLTSDIELEDNNLDMNSESAKMDCVLLTNEIYGKTFDNYDEVTEFYSHFMTAKEAIRETIKPEILFWDETVSVDPADQWEAHIKGTVDDWQKPNSLELVKKPNYLLFSILSRMIQANSVLFGASYYDANPLITAPVSFHWLNYSIKAKRNIISQKMNLDFGLDLPLTNALLSKNLEWLGNVPIESLIDLREKNQLSELRSVINLETKRFSAARINNLEAITCQVDYNLSSALEKHHEELNTLANSYRTAMGIAVPSFLISIVGTFQPLIFPYATIIPAISDFVGKASIAAITHATIQYLRKKKTLGRSPIGILWDAREKR